MKKVKFTFWLLGFGCGIALMAMISALLTLQIDLNTLSSEISSGSASSMSIEQKESQKIIPYKEEIPNIQVESNKKDNEEQVLPNKSNEKEINQNKPIEDSGQEVRKVYIPANSVASEICTILEKAEVIEDSKSFLEYIKSHQKQTKLKDGYFELPYKGDYNILLELLLA